MSSLRLTRLGHRDALLVLAAGDLFGTPPTEEGARRFLEMPGHHLVLVARDDSRLRTIAEQIRDVHPVQVEVIAADLADRLQLVEEPRVDARALVHVLEGHPGAQQRRGIASALLRELQAIATERGCSALWTVTDTDNEAALATYRSLGARDSSGKTMLEWDGGHATR